jgi:NAD(P)-dependent dehydrogenase (short-subunit alcohol dehydrogenase family)
MLHQRLGRNTYGAVTELTEDQWDTVLDINLKGNFLLAKHVAPIPSRAAAG